MNDGRHSRRSATALRRMAEEDPALGALSLWCRHRDCDSSGPAPAWSDASTIHYRPAFEKLTVIEQIGLCGHHVLHIALRHAARSGRLGTRLGDRFDPDLFNIATDALLNDTLLLAGYALPRPCLRASELLSEIGRERLSPEEAVARFDAERLYLQLLEDRRGGSDGRRPVQSADEDGAQALREYGQRRGFAPDLQQGDTEADGEDTDDTDWRQHLARAIEAGRQSGRGIGVIAGRLADLPVRRTPWEVHLRRLLQRAVMEGPERDPARPARRWLAADSEARRRGTPAPGFEPGWRRQRDAPRIAIGLDCSGSIDAARLALFAGEVAGVARRTGAALMLLPFDVQVHGVLRPRPGTEAAALRGIPFARGGGTDFAPVLAEAAALDPAIIVVLTDLEGPCGAAPPVPVLWAVPGEATPRPPFGRVLALDA